MQNELRDLDARTDFMLPADEGATSSPHPINVTLNAQSNRVDNSLHLHEAMNLPDGEAAERLQRLYPDFMKEVMDGRRKEQEFRHTMNLNAQTHDAELAKLQTVHFYEATKEEKQFAHQRFNAAVATMMVVALIFAVVAVVSLLKSMYYPAAGMGLGMAYAFHQVVRLLRASVAK